MRGRSAALAMVIAGLAATLPAVLTAQVPSPPHRFYGEARINGVPAPDGTAIVALVGTVECGRSETAGGMYRVDALAQTMRTGCGSAGAEVQFRVGPGTATQRATWNGATVTRLDLAAQAGAYTTATLAMDSPCIPTAGTARCDATRLRLWQGDAEAWSLLYKALGTPPAPKLFDDLIKLRLEAGDPAARSMAATAAGWPYLKITAIHFRGTQPGEADEYVEIANLGGGPQAMDGWLVRRILRSGVPLPHGGGAQGRTTLPHLHRPDRGRLLPRLRLRRHLRPLGRQRRHRHPHRRLPRHHRRYGALRGRSSGTAGRAGAAGRGVRAAARGSSSRPPSLQVVLPVVYDIPAVILRGWV